MSETPSNDAKRAVVYVRASLDRTGEGASVARQEEACRALATARGWQVIAIKADNSVSASTGKRRPAWEEVLSMIEAGEVDVVIAWHMDRITRSMLDLERLILLAVDSGVGIATATGDVDLTTDAGRMVARILAAVARAEVERKAARQVLAYQQKAMGGTPNWGTRPFGFERDGTIREAEAEALAEAYRDVLNGSPLRAVAQRLNEADFPTTYGGPWSGHTLRPVLLNPRNIGKVTYRGEIVADMACDPIVAEDTFYAARHVLTDPARATGGGGTVSSLLTGLAECGACGQPVKVLWKGKKGEPGSYRRYSCRGKGCVTMRADWVDGQVFLRLLSAAEKWAGAVYPKAEPGKVRALAEEKTALLVRLDEVAASFAEGGLTISQVTTASERMRSRLSAVEDELAALGVASGGFLVGADIEYVAQEFDGMPLDRQRTVVTEVFDRIVLLPRGKGVPVTRKEHIVTLLKGEDPQSLVLDVPRLNPYGPLADILVTSQPDGVDTLAKAAAWLGENRHTTRAPSGLPGKLSPLLRFDRSAGEWVRRSNGSDAPDVQGSACTDLLS